MDVGCDMKREKGHTLIELIIFLVIMGILTASMILAITMSLEHMPNIHDASTAIGLGQQRMEFVLGQRAIKGYSSFTDTCTGGSPPALCTDPSGFTTSSTVTSVSGGKLITVTVTGNAALTLTEEVRDY